MILYIIISFIKLCLLIFAFIKLKYPFWAIQPVFHFYDLYYWIINVGIIRPELPSKNKYTNFNKINTRAFSYLDELTKKEICLLVKLHYLRNGHNIYNPEQSNILPYFIGHNSTAYWSFYTEQELILDNKHGKTITNNVVIGSITSRPLHVEIKSNRKDSKFDVYYVDYLCVHKKWRNKGIAPQLIQTHEYNQSYNNRKICVSLFKREEDLTGIVPLTVYKTYCFDMTKMGVDKGLHPKYEILKGNKQNIYHLYDFLKETNKYDIFIYPELTNVCELVDTSNLYVSMIKYDREIIAAYIFRKTCTYLEKDKEMISCIASVNGNVLTNEDFIHGFKLSLHNILKEDNKFIYLSIEDISDNYILINNVCRKVSPLKISPMAYFFYNFAYNTFRSDKCLVIN